MMVLHNITMISQSPDCLSDLLRRLLDVENIFNFKLFKADVLLPFLRTEANKLAPYDEALHESRDRIAVACYLYIGQGGANVLTLTPFTRRNSIALYSDVFYDFLVSVLPHDCDDLLMVKCSGISEYSSVYPSRSDTWIFMEEEDYERFENEAVIDYEWFFLWLHDTFGDI